MTKDFKKEERSNSLKKKQSCRVGGFNSIEILVSGTSHLK